MHDLYIRMVWLALAALAALILGISAGVISWISNHNTGGALFVGGGAFSNALLLIITAIRFVAGRDA